MENVIAFPGRDRPQVTKTEAGFTVSARGDWIDSAMEAYLAGEPWPLGALALVFDEWEPGDDDGEVLFFGAAA